MNSDVMALLCQLESLALSLLVILAAVSCSSKQPAEESPPGGAPIAPTWFNAPKRFAPMSPTGGIASHPFFDSNSGETKKNEVYFHLVTAEGSPFGYRFDLLSGTKHRRFKYCEQRDIWSDYDGSINLPPYNVGIVPRLMNRRGGPQKIIVFGNVNGRNRDLLGVTYLKRARVVGGVILQYCKSYPCKGHKGWHSNLVLVGVGSEDDSLKNVRDLRDLVGVIDWEHAKAFLVNGGGHKVSFPRNLPAYRISGEIGAKRAMKVVSTKGYRFKLKEMSSLRSNCSLLYDYVWKNILKIKKDTEVMRTMIKEDTKQLGETYLNSPSTKKAVYVENSPLDKIAQKIKSKKLQTLNDWFWNFYSKNGKDFSTCSKFVRPSDLKENIERHWFFVYLTNFFNLEKLGHYYHCPSKSWVKNAAERGNKLKYKLYVKRKCTNEQLNNAFTAGIGTMESLRHKNHEHYRYIEYDFGVGGSHDRIHNWVFSTGKQLSCIKQTKNLASKSYRAALIPKDVRWADFSIKINAASNYIVR